MSHSVSIGGAFKDVLASWVGVSGGWKRVLGRWVAVGGEWKQSFVAGAVRILPATIRGFAVDPDVPTARIDFTSEGDVTATYTDQTMSASTDLGNWYDPIDPGIGASFEIRANQVAGSATVGGSALGAWLSLSATQAWEIFGGGAFNAGNTASLKVDIRAAGGTEILASAIYQLTVVTFEPAYSSGFEGREGGVNKPIPYRWDV